MAGDISAFASRRGSGDHPHVGKLFWTVGLIAAVSFGNAGCGFSAPADGDGGTPPGVGFQFPSSLTDEAVGTHLVSVALSNPSTDNVTVDVEVTGGSADGNDFSLNTSTLQFVAGETRADVELTINADGEEPDETIELKLSHATNAMVIHDSHVVTISSDVLPRIQFNATMSSDNEDTGTRTLQLMMDIPSPVQVRVGVGVAGTASSEDYSPVAGEATIEPGVTTGTVDIPIITDNFDEYD